MLNSTGLVATIVLALIVSLPAARADDHCAAATVPCSLTLHGPGSPAASAGCSSEAWRRHLRFELDKLIDGNGDGYFESVLALDLAPAKGCSGVTVTVLYDAEGKGMSAHIGDSPTNDGHGGDAGTTRYDAELYIRGRLLAVAAADGPEPQHGQGTGWEATRSEQLLMADLGPLSGQRLELSVRDQWVGVRTVTRQGMKGTDFSLSSQSDQRLFALAGQDTTATLDGERRDYQIYAAFNRVINHLYGSPVGGRYGSGVRRVELRMQAGP